ncbi:MAG: hypothetical protein KAV82_10200 [Phycisphaerae bacterium]|nr:hypothetical protein [Phycisphaerae bacterium]
MTQRKRQLSPALCCLGWVSAIVVVVGAPAILPQRSQIAPVIISDNAYIFLAADRFYAGDGLTTLLPHAPFQPWEWQQDWAFLTRWPVGYPLLLCAVRWVLGTETVQAAQALNVLCCGLALVGWFAWTKRAMPGGLCGVLLAGVAAGCSVSVSMLLDPSTDAVLVAALPFVLLTTSKAIRRLDKPAVDTASSRWAAAWLVSAGLGAGGLFWIRYASLFVPLGIGGYLLVEWLLLRRLQLRHLGAFGLAAAAPILALLLINHMFGLGRAQAQLNLGSTVGFHFTPDMLSQAWWNFTRFGFYDYHWYSRWVFALWPAAVVAVVVVIPPVRRRLRRFMANPAVGLSAFVVAALMVVLVGATTFFGDKFNYVALGRYYQPIKPLYFVLFAAPVLLVPLRVVRMGACVVLLVAGWWLVRQEWPLAYKRQLEADHRTTPYHRRAVYFEPHSTALYEWLKRHGDDRLLVFSNFHDEIALETWIPACPTPAGVSQMHDWVARVKRARCVASLRVLFVLDPDNHCRRYFLPPTEDLVQTFNLTNLADAPPSIAPYLYTPTCGQDSPGK